LRSIPSGDQGARVPVRRRCCNYFTAVEWAVAMKRILIIEDVELNRDLLIQLLEDDYELMTAVDGGAGVEKAANERPDLILMDLSLPVIDGWEATRRIKANTATTAIPVIAITAHAMSGDEEKARAAGCDDFMTKPIDENLLFAKLRQWLG
jgi:CheY-like chemotaxis protein